MPTSSVAPAAVRVLPPSRPRARRWVDPGVLQLVREPDPAPAPRSGGRGMVASGQAWAAPVDRSLPDAVRWSTWFAVALGEAVLGRRPATRLDAWTSAQVRADLVRSQRLRPAEGLAVRPVLVSGRVQHPAAGVAEASAVLRVGPRLLVLAFRLEAVEGEWACTAVQVGLTPADRRATAVRRAAASRRTPAAPAAGAPAPAAGTR